MEEGLRSIDSCKEGRMQLDLNLEPVEEVEDTLIPTGHDSVQKCDVWSLENKLEENAGSGNGATLYVEESKVMQCGVSADVKINGDPCSPRARRGRKRKNAEGPTGDDEMDTGKDVGAVNVEGANLHSYEGAPVPQKCRRGRKRKNVENSQCHDNEVQRKKDGHLPVSGTTGNVGKVLRSRVIGVSQPEIVQSEKPYSTRNTEIAPPKKSKKVKGRRGRPPKIRDNDVLAPPKDKDKKKVKGRRGRPPKMPDKDGVSGIVISQKDKVIESKEKIRHKKDGNVIKSSKFSKSQLESTAPQQLINDQDEDAKKSMKLKEGDASRRTQQQAVRNQIVGILIKAGWTVQYRPRQTKDYSDAVYVDCNGRTHWSVTLAYRKLKEKVDTGAADEKTLSAFSAIPEEVLGTLLRSRQKEGYKKLSKKSGSKPKCKEKLNVNPKKKKKLNAPNHDDRDHLMKASNKGRSRSKNGGRNRKRYALLARKSGELSDQDGDGFELYDGKRSLLSWLIDFGTVQSNAELQYMNARRTRVMLEGKITGDGICCGCCSQTLTLLDFESHAGSTLGQPLEHICLASGRSLLQCLADSWSKHQASDLIGFHLVDVDADDPNDDTCNICGDGGDLICCDGCPSTFHQNCLNIQKLPSGNWRCVYCSCKFCETVAGKSCHVDDHMTVSELSSCHLCEERFHFACNQGETADNLDSKKLSFCGKGCEKVFEGLQKLLGVKHDLEEGFSWTILHRFIGQDVIGSDSSLRIKCNSKLAVAFSVMDECFMPIVDQRSKINMIHNVVYNCGSNFRRLNYCGFYTVILEKGDELVAAASIRLHGSQLAEMPFIGTRYRYRRQGMCRRLMGGIETALCSLGVEQLVIPAIPELIETWTNVFGFMPLEESKRREMVRMSMVVFPGTDMLQKPLLKHQDSEDRVMSAEVSSEVDLNKNVVTLEPVESSCVNSSHGFLQNASDMKTGFESFIPKEALSVQ